VKYEIRQSVGGIRNGELYQIEDTTETELEWKSLLAAFQKEFSEFTRLQSSSSKGDYELGDWHHGMRSIFAFLYSENFYDKHFLNRVQNILQRSPFDCFAKFECYNDNIELIGWMMVFKDHVEFDHSCEENGLIKKLIAEAT